MYQKSKKCVAMLLAGGQGARLMSLTKDLAKPAVSFGGKYRIIDFPLSNCINSGVDTIGVLTQYQPFDLNQYIGNGQPWDLDRLYGGVFVLPPYMRGKEGEWYKGTANAIYQNLSFIDRFAPEHVLILSGDHIYKMDYNLMLGEHKKRGADCTIAVIDVTKEEASRFGIMNTDAKGKIIEFEEKPKNPKSTNASMGIYIFRYEVLKKYLQEDEANKQSENDFGKNIIPSMLADGQRLFAYKFEGYWKDVGTISSLWEANMNLLDESSGLNLSDKDWRIYCRNSAEPPHFVEAGASVRNSLVTEGCTIGGSVKDSVISHGVTVGKKVVIERSVIMDGAVIEDGAEIRYAIVGQDARIGKNARIGESLTAPKSGEWEITVIAPHAAVGENAIIDKGRNFE